MALSNSASTEFVDSDVIEIVSADEYDPQRVSQFSQLPRADRASYVSLCSVMSVIVTLQC